METCRYLPLLKQGGKVIANDLKIQPPAVLSGQTAYPDDLPEVIRSRFPDFLLVDGQKLATEAGNPRAANTVLLGAVSKLLDIPEEFWFKALGRMVPAKALEVNRKAFQMGREL
jgi:indolepyruvate ferredoxin oxidoreductase beta subunit